MKILKILPALAIAVFLSVSGGCSLMHMHLHGNGRVVSLDRSVSDFRGVVLNGVGNINVYYSEDCRVVVTTDSNIQNIIVTEVNGGFLHINEHCHGSFNPTKLKVDIYMPELNFIKLKGAGNIRIMGGSTDNLDLVLSGCGNIDAQNIVAENVVVSLSGAGDIKTWVTGSLTGSLSGVGSILYKGNPSTNNIHRTGVGNIRKL